MNELFYKATGIVVRFVGPRTAEVIVRYSMSQKIAEAHASAQQEFEDFKKDGRAHLEDNKAPLNLSILSADEQIRLLKILFKLAATESVDNFLYLSGLKQPLRNPDSPPSLEGASIKLFSNTLKTYEFDKAYLGHARANLAALLRRIRDDRILQHILQAELKLRGNNILKRLSVRPESC